MTGQAASASRRSTPEAHLVGAVYQDDLREPPGEGESAAHGAPGVGAVLHDGAG